MWPASTEDAASAITTVMVNSTTTPVWPLWSFRNLRKHDIACRFIEPSLLSGSRNEPEHNPAALWDALFGFDR
jgi:hypothetical protein